MLTLIDRRGIISQIIARMATPEFLNTMSESPITWSHISEPLAMRIDIVHTDTTGYQYLVRLGNITVMRFSIMNFPSCCGAVLLHNFFVSSDVVKYFPKGFLDELMDGLIGMSKHDMWFASRRLFVTFLEYRKDVPHEMDSRLVDWPMPTAPQTKMIQYKPLWDYFHKQERVKTNLMWNKNTGNLIHSMEVLFNEEKF